jgi:hypothetical protein
MKLTFTPLALALLLSSPAHAAGTFSIYMNSESQNSCAVGNLTNLTGQADGNLVAITSGATFSAACGLGSGTAPTATLNIAPTALTAGQTQATITWTAKNVSSCNTTGTSAGVATEFPNAWTNTNVSCANNQCTGGTNTVTTTPILNGTDGTYTFGLQCLTASGNAGVFATQSVTVSGSSGGGGGGTSCTQGSTGDIPNFTALCSGVMTLHNPGITTLGPSAYTYSFVFGAPWPGSYYGDTMVFSVGSTQFLAIPFTPSPTGGVNFSENQTYTPKPLTMAISKQPGVFGTYNSSGASTDTTGNVICGQSGGNPSLKASSTVPYPLGTTCKLNSSQQYWLNIALAQYNAANGQWITTCSSGCTIGIGLYTGN